MGISKEEAIKELQNRETVFVAYSQATKLPYVKCDEETYNDQAWIFSTEEGIKEFGKKMLEEKVLLMGMKFTKKDYPRLYGTFYAIGVNTVVWVDGEDKIEIDLPDIAKQADMSKIEPAKRPLLNPTLELSGIYFMQELRRPVEKDQHGNLRELEEELIVNLKKSEYLVAMNVDPEDPKKINIPYLKNKKEKILISGHRHQRKNYPWTGDGGGLSGSSAKAEGTESVYHALPRSRRKRRGGREVQVQNQGSIVHKPSAGVDDFRRSFACQGALHTSGAADKQEGEASASGYL